MSARRLARGLLLPVLLLVPVTLAAQTRYIAFGDSITVGVGDDESRPEAERGYPPRLEAMLNEAGQAAVVSNRGLGAEKTPEGLTRLDEVLASEEGDVLLLMEGSNDISREISRETTLFNLGEMARKAEAAGLEVVHATVIPRIPRARVDADNVLNRRLNRHIRDLAGTRGRDLADNFEVFWRLPDRFADFYWDQPTDRVGHPNAAGYDVMAEVFFDVLTGADTVSPVPGILRPDDRAEGVSASSRIEVDVWDFGEGIDVANSTLVVNGVEVETAVSGDERGATLRHDPPEPLAGVIEVGLNARDLATPANSFAREVARFTIAGTEFLDGDLDLDGRVDGVDLVAFARRFGASRGDGRYAAGADFDDNGVIDGADLARLAANFGRRSF